MYTIPAREIKAAKHQHSLSYYYVTGDNGAHYEILAVVDGQIFVESVRLGCLARVVQTGKRIDLGGQVRVRIEFAADLGDAEGTLSFGEGDHIGGKAQAYVFASLEG